MAMEPASFYENMPATELLKLATSYKYDGDVKEAIRCLRFFKKKPHDETSGIPISSHLRLPLYLQEAGFFDEAMKEFNDLLRGVDSYVDDVFNHQPLKIRRMLAHARNYSIYDKMRLACEREGKIDDAHKYNNLYVKHKKAHTKAIQAESVRKSTSMIKENNEHRRERKTEKSAFQSNAKLPDPSPATQNVRVTVGYSKKEIIETVLGLLIIVLIIWGIIHFLF